LQQNHYANILLDIANNEFTNSQSVFQIDTTPDEYRHTISIENINSTTDITALLLFMYPIGHNVNDIMSGAILATTNEHVDEWNEKVQELNPNDMISMFSTDSFADIDDPHGHLASSITPEALNRFNKIDVPKHELQLKINDICFLTHVISRKDGLSKNSRVRIIHMDRYSIRVSTLDLDHPVYYSIPRIRFKFRLPFEQSFYMIRTQFPLRLAYAMTYDKSQGQSLQKVGIDIRRPSFSHGHTYVAFSRVRDVNNLIVFCDLSQVASEINGVYVSNIVYPMLQNIPPSTIR
jgi:hypothetical protein